MSPVLFRIGEIPVYTYGVMLALALMIAYAGSGFTARYRSLSSREVHDIIFIGFIAGLLGGRFYYALAHAKYYAVHPLKILKYNEGGLTWYGAFIAAVAVVSLYCRIKGLSKASVFDVSAPMIALGQSLGRLGCWFNGCCSGTLDLFPGLRISSQMFESVAMLMLTPLLILMLTRTRRRGVVGGLYLLAYSCIRFIGEYARFDQPSLLGITHAQWISVLLFLSGGVLLLSGRSDDRPRV